MVKDAAVLLFCLLNLFALDGFCATLSVSDMRYPLRGADLAVLRDKSGTLGIEEVTSERYANAFQATTDTPSLGYSKDAVWLRITLTKDAAAPTDWLLEVTNPYINDLRFYAPADGSFSFTQAGDRFPFSQRKIIFHHPVFSLNLPDSIPRTFYLRMESDSTLAAQFVIWKPTAMRDRSQLEVLVLGGTMGMILMSLMISGIHWLFSRDPVLLGFSVLTAVVIFFVPAQLGLASQFLFPNAPHLADAFVPWTLATTIATIQVVFGNALAIATYQPKISKFLWVLTTITMLLPLTREFDAYATIGGPGLQTTFMLGLLCTAWASFRRWRSKVNGAGYLVIAHCAFIVSLLVGRLTFLGVLEANALTLAAWLPGLIAFLFLVHIGIVVKAREDYSNHIAARNDAMAARAVYAKEQNMRQDQANFFAFVAHELRSPLAVIIIGLQNIHRELSGAAESVHARLKRIDRAAHRMGELVERHLTLQRMAIADFEPTLSEIDPQQLAIDAIADVKEEFPHRNFDCVAGSNIFPEVRLDCALVQTALVNLLGNAARYSSPREPILLKITQTDSILHYQVTDYGPGVPAAERSRLFEIFKRSVHSQSTVGFGIGLATVRRVAEVHGGKVTYTEGDGGAAIFTLTLPVAQIETENP
ncbi:MAG TPA: sensor histidine kinase [Rhodoferax sp.]|jgi:signal transduction histidine kinase|nr:sensor histidine kinase [Rhodoferax sp.]HNV59606.1 sensor histidine kinase [Rhodoferax sp.]